MEDVDSKCKVELLDDNNLGMDLGAYGRQPRVESPEPDPEIRNIEPPVASSYAKLLKQVSPASLATARKIAEIDLQLKALQMQKAALEFKKDRLMEKLVDQQLGGESKASERIIDEVQKMFKK